jgi:biopolymer transport protein ExbD
MKRLAQDPSRDTGVEINLSPLIDCVFLLLIFFIVTTVFVEETGVEVNKPLAASAAELEKQSILIAVTADGRIVHGGREWTLHSLRGLVARQLREQDRPVILLADGEGSVDRLVEVIDECKLAGAQKVSVAARPK